MTAIVSNIRGGVRILLSFSRSYIQAQENRSLPPLEKLGIYQKLPSLRYKGFQLEDVPSTYDQRRWCSCAKKF